ncbi:hypothetical protein IU501_31095 [Nocardia otitidiscaviarum]|uniref:Uncharacterized protein n=1 Tax=Nocardia otitidiscaviarum TaxID=1823 RepID=A0A379JLH7_9NOCA|nr:MULTISPECIES: hypothetical protein [Nocardia]MBF6137425.1 hypothetical protein [Nocardia otitidiscaviarum]MBF6182187.1 hypothetical protein [Nocardia otitidiscaviarum]MBF6241141.1 hypothetical protein [Nocardia otitidiscaviarum]MBF6488314.1 hypothetical protein [Nocardia otitidiscaviarum]MCP9624755.1 hypothetical protein [Nocardia otitidiscaviarum]
MNDALRFVSTVDELDALPLLSVIMAAKPSRSVFQKWIDRQEGGPTWVRMMSDDRYTSEELSVGPFPLSAPQRFWFVVLYDPSVQGHPNDWEIADELARDRAE